MTFKASAPAYYLQACRSARHRGRDRAGARAHEKALHAAGSSKERAVKCLVFLADMADFQAMNEAYAAFFDGHKPARSTGAKVEMECIPLAG